MYRSITHTLRPLAATPSLSGRQIHLGARHARQLSGHPVSMTQGHTTTKAADPLYRDKDVQSEGVVKADKSRKNAGTGKDPGFDTAKEGGHVEHAEARESEGLGSLKDHRGDQQKVGARSQMGGEEESAGGSTGDSILKAIGLGGKKTPAEKKGKSFHSSARSFLPESDKLDGARKPVESSLHGDQNQHLKHSEPSTPDSGKGNAGPSPSLPSKQGTTSSSSTSSQGQKRSFNSSARARANEDDPLKQDVNKDEPNSLTMKPAEEESSESNKSGDKQKPDEKKAPLPKEEKEKAAKGMRRGLHTSATSAAQSGHPGYAKALEGEPNTKGKNAPPTGLPQELGAAYDKAKAHPAPDAGAEPSSKVDFSSTASAGPNEALKQAAKDGTLAERNPQPDTPKYGKVGLDDGWKERKHQ